MSNWKAFQCLECGKDTSNRPKGLGEYYMVQDAIWAVVAQDNPRGMLCIGCLEGRLGRELNAQDFTDCPLNEDNRSSDWRGSARLKERLDRKPLL